MAPSTRAHRRDAAVDITSSDDEKAIETHFASRKPDTASFKNKLESKPRRLKAQRSDLTVVEGGCGVIGTDDAEESPQQDGKRRRGPPRQDAEETDELRFKYRRLPGSAADAAGGRELTDAVWARLPSEFSEDYFAAPLHGRILTAGVDDPTQKVDDCQRVPEVSPNFEQWLRLLQLGFTLLVEGCGSKRKVLEAFAAEKLMPWKAVVVRMDGYAARFPTAECLREVLAQVHPNALPASKTSIDSVVSALCAARSEALAKYQPLRPLCLVVHSLDSLPLVHQAALATLASKAPRLHIVASVDSLWAESAWTCRISRDFLACHVQAHTHELYETEAAARYPGGLPGWADPAADKRRAPKESVSIVLRSLTNIHRELVQVIASHQRDAGGTGITGSELLTIATDRMIASHRGKLNILLKELTDHKVVVERSSGDATLYQLPYNDKMLHRLADGDPLDEDGSADEESEDAEPA